VYKVFAKKKIAIRACAAISAVPTSQALIAAPTPQTHLHPKLRQMQAVQLLVITKACRPIQSYRLISIHG
jgi:hypothetical protein